MRLARIKEVDVELTGGSRKIQGGRSTGKFLPEDLDGRFK
jgi:hypothetical protein